MLCESIYQHFLSKWFSPFFRQRLCPNFEKVEGRETAQAVFDEDVDALSFRNALFPTESSSLVNLDP